MSIPKNRNIQKEKTRRAIINAAFNQLSANKSFSNLSLREVTREANIAPTSFYRHFKDMDDLGLTMVDEAGLILRQLMRQARYRIEIKGSIIVSSIDIFFEFINYQPNIFRLLLREVSGTSDAFRAAVFREISHFVLELANYIQSVDKRASQKSAYIQAEAMVTLVFTTGSRGLDVSKKEQKTIKKRLIYQILMIIKGSNLVRIQ